jgi:hypothetical protein
LSKKNEEACDGKKGKKTKKKDNGAAVESATYLMENPITDLANKNKISAHPTILITGERGQRGSFLFFRYFPLFSLKF